MDEKHDQNISSKGITLLVGCLNNADFDVFLDFNEPDEAAFKTFAFFLSLSERGKSFGLIAEKIKELRDKGDEKSLVYIDKIEDYKRKIDSSLDVPAVLPREVFRKK